MKITKTLLAIALPVALSAGCAMDVGSSSDGLTIQENSDFGINQCGGTIERWIDDADWPIETVVAGELEFTQGELMEYIINNPNDPRTELIGALAAAQLNMTTALVIPDGVIAELVAADDLLMAPDDEDGTPPPVNFDDFSNIQDFNNFAALDCFEGGAVVAEPVEQTVDTRDDLVQPTPGTLDLRPNLFTEE